MIAPGDRGHRNRYLLKPEECTTMRLGLCFVMFALVFLYPEEGVCDVITNFQTVSAYIAEPGNRTLSFGGTVTDTSGNLINGNRDIRFSLYDSATGGIPLIVEDVTASLLNGRLSYQLGTNAPLSSSVFDGYNGFNRYLGVSVNGVDLGRMSINNSGVGLTGTGVQIQGSTALSAYIAEPGNRTLSFGGTVTDTSGSLINGNRDIRFSLYDSATGGIPLFVEDVTASLLNGRLSYQLGTNAPLSSSVFDGYNGFNRFLGISINGIDSGRFLLNTSSGLSITAVPEPSSIMLIGFGSGLLFFFRHNRDRAK